MKDERQRCDEMVYENTLAFPRPRPCSRYAVVTTDSGKHYCRQHDPTVIQARREAQQKRWGEESAERLRQYQQEKIERAMIAVLRERGIETIEQLLAVLEGRDDGW